MATKKKTVKSSTASYEVKGTDIVEKVKRPAVTQVVEVVESAPEQASEESDQKETLEETVGPDTPSLAGTSDESEEKKRELVDELFQKNEVGGPEVVPEISVHTRSSSKSLFFWAIGVIVACLVVGGALLLSARKTNLIPSIVIIPTPTPTAVSKPSATPTPKLARDAISIRVLNGGGKAGAASKMKTFLEDKGYKVTGTGNADNYNYDKTEVLVKASKAAYISLLSTDLKDTYSLGTTAATLEDSETSDARVIVGKE